MTHDGLEYIALCAMGASFVWAIAWMAVRVSQAESKSTASESPPPATPSRVETSSVDAQRPIGFQRQRARCQVDGCRIVKAHSHTEDLIRRIKEK